MKETLAYHKYSKFEFFLKRTESRGFVLVFVRKTSEFLTAKHWPSYVTVTVTQKRRRTVLKNVNTESDLPNKRACSLNIFHILEGHFLVFKELFSENSVLMY